MQTSIVIEKSDFENFLNTYYKSLPLNLNYVNFINNFNNNIHHFKISDKEYIFNQEKFQWSESSNSIDFAFNNKRNFKKIINIMKSPKVPIIFNPYFAMLYISADSYLNSYTIGFWIIFSLAQVINDFTHVYNDEPDIKWCTLGIKYAGLGYYSTLRMDITNGNLFIQLEGGSNDYDRITSYHNCKNQIIEDNDFISYNNLIDILINGT